ncbi:hypothetical protein FLL45_01435 [Aliikangiella marina]|uniref:Uncharacterized protein n=1 Tax=Aliikangiella marina TaxID=1712262 RepID=A0A545THE0_9GAMM|nr:hypothetical protein [Aliikangiella marina]TQV76649.1 hypothetical protein FLL45_01435 [Aliikangiella marina]
MTEQERKLLFQVFEDPNTSPHKTYTRREAAVLVRCSAENLRKHQGTELAPKHKQVSPKNVVYTQQALIDFLTE